MPRRVSSRRASRWYHDNVTKWRPTVRRWRAQAVLAFALTVPILLLGLIDLGRLMLTELAPLQGAVNAGLAVPFTTTYRAYAE
jgi:hypothetical protein